MCHFVHLVIGTILMSSLKEKSIVIQLSIFEGFGGNIGNVGMDDKKKVSIILQMSPQ